MSSMIAAILESGEYERLYTGLSLLVSAASDGTPARGLVTFGALGPLLDDDLQTNAAAPGATAHVIPGELGPFARTLAELRDIARELPDCRIWACAAAVEATGTPRERIDARFDGVMSTPRFLRETDGARLVVV
jgi:peroxiredoxin family protein